MAPRSEFPAQVLQEPRDQDLVMSSAHDILRNADPITTSWFRKVLRWRSGPVPRSVEDMQIGHHTLPSTTPDGTPYKVTHTDDKWRALLCAEEFHVLAKPGPSAHGAVSPPARNAPGDTRVEAARRTCSPPPRNSTLNAAGRRSGPRLLLMRSLSSRTARSARYGSRCAARRAVHTWGTCSQGRAWALRPTCATASTRCACNWSGSRPKRLKAPV